VGTDIIEDDERAVDASDGIVADARLDGGHSRVDKVGHDCRIPDKDTGDKQAAPERREWRGGRRGGELNVNVGEVDPPLVLLVDLAEWRPRDVSSSATLYSTTIGTCLLCYYRS
jgi:hypothetical protein